MIERWAGDGRAVRESQPRDHQNRKSSSPRPSTLEKHFESPIQPPPATTIYRTSMILSNGNPTRAPHEILQGLAETSLSSLSLWLFWPSCFKRDGVAIFIPPLEHAISTPYSRMADPPTTHALPRHIFVSRIQRSSREEHVATADKS